MDDAYDPFDLEEVDYEPFEENDNTNADAKKSIAVSPSRQIEPNHSDTRLEASAATITGNPLLISPCSIENNNIIKEQTVQLHNVDEVPNSGVVDTSCVLLSGKKRTLIEESVSGTDCSAVSDTIMKKGPKPVVTNEEKVRQP